MATTDVQSAGHLEKSSAVTTGCDLECDNAPEPDACLSRKPGSRLPSEPRPAPAPVTKAGVSRYMNCYTNCHVNRLMNRFVNSHVHGLVNRFVNGHMHSLMSRFMNCLSDGRQAAGRTVRPTVFAQLAMVASALALGSSSLTAQTSLAETTYDRAARNWRSLRTLQATFEQKITNTLIGRTATSKGTFLQERPSRIAVTFTDPVGDRIVGDGDFLWVYLPSSAPGQVMKLPASSDGAVVADLLGQLLDSPTRSFLITGGDEEQIGGKATRRITVVPREPSASPFRRATVWVSETEARPVRLQVQDAQGIDRTITLLTWTPNAVMPKDAFVFTVPRGVKVVTGP